MGHPVSKSQDSVEVHPFGGCNKIRTHYRMVGDALLEYEHGGSGSDRQFRIGVAFVPVEVLESYLEDLLDLEIKEDRLCIYRERSGVPYTSLCLAGLLAALGFGLYAASKGASLVFSFGLSVCLAFPFAIFWHSSPREGSARRMRFAKVVSHEILRRRGTDKEGRISRRFLFGDFWGHASSGSVSGAAFSFYPFC